MRAAIIGAGAMGSALSIPLADNNVDVRIWGTELDRKILNELKNNNPHPSLGVRVPERVTIYNPEELNEALGNVDTIILAVTSKAINAIARRVREYLRGEEAVFTVSKGFVSLEEDIVTPCEAASRGLRGLSVGALAGPTIASELARRIPTAMVVAHRDRDIVRQVVEAFNVEYLRVEEDDDVMGVEVSASLKNIYAIILGIIDGYGEKIGVSMNNTRGWIFTESVREMAEISNAMGGRRETVYQLAGIGDLETTARGGRNYLFGKLVGLGNRPSQALERMREMGKGTVEGYSTLPNAYKLVERMGIKDRARLLVNLHQSIVNDKPLTPYELLGVK